MLAPHHIIFTTLEGALLDAASGSWEAAGEALNEIERRHVPLILVTRHTRAQIEPLRRKIGHAHPFITENGGGLFIPDGYFSMHLEGAMRAARYFCVPFGRPYAEAVEAVEEIAAEAGCTVMGYARMTAREIASNTGQSVKEAELDRQREFGERFFFAGENEAAVKRFAEIAHERKWQAAPGEPFWEMSSAKAGGGNEPGQAIRYLMRLHRTSTRMRLRSVGIGSTVQDLPLLTAVDQAILLPTRKRELAPELTSRLPQAVLGEAGGPQGWNDAILKLLEGAAIERR
jgi:mannosyl-3-phosphoglycerate phosphatase family protein